MPSKIPATVNVAIIQLRERIKRDTPPDELEKWICADEDAAVATIHHGAGTSLRNEWGLWLDNDLTRAFYNDYGLTHADDMIGLLYTVVHRDLNGRAWRSNDVARNYKDYWEKHGNMPPPAWERPKTEPPAQRAPGQSPEQNAEAIKLAIDLTRALCRFDGIKRIFDRTPTMDRVIRAADQSEEQLSNHGIACIRDLVVALDHTADLMSNAIVQELDQKMKDAEGG